MGYEQVPNVRDVHFKDFSPGWFPGREHNEIPGEFTNPNAPVGASDANAVVWYQGALRKMFGYSVVTSSALNGVVTSLFYSPMLDVFVGTAGAVIYSGMNNAAPTDITGGLTISTTAQPHWIEWQFTTTSYLICVDGTNQPFKWTGSGSCALLAGSPPSGSYIVAFQNAVWIARTSTQTATVFFSNLTDAETWTTSSDYYSFDSAITGMGVLGDKLVVFKNYSIGVMSGSNNRSLTKIDKFINGIGCTSGHSITNARLSGQEVLIFHSYDGWYAFDGSQQLTKLSSPLQRKYVSSTSTLRWNEARFSKIVSAYFPKFSWNVNCLSDGGDSTNNFMVLQDCSKVYEDKNGPYIPHWPFDSINANCLTVANISGVETIYFGADDSLVYKFDPTLFNRNGTAYNGYFTSKIFDAITDWIIQEVNVIGDQQSSTLTFYVNSDLEQGDGESGVLDFTEDGDVLDTTFIMDVSAFGGKDFIFNNVGIDNYGRFLQFKMSNAVAGKALIVEEVNFILQTVGLETNVEDEA